MSVRERNGLYYIRVQVGGQRIERAVGRDATKEDAKALEAKIRREIIEGRLGKQPDRTIDDAILKWLTGEALSIQVDSSKVRAVREFTKGRRLTEIVDAADSLKAAGLNAGLSPATINRRVAILRRIANLAHDQWGWLQHPLGKKIKTVPGETPRYVQITLDQARNLLGCCATRSRPAILLAVLTGMREGEILRFDPARHLQGARIILDAENKTGRPRIIPLTKQAHIEAKKWVSGALTYSMLRDDFESARKDAGMPWLHFKDLRRTFGSWIVQQTGSLKAAQDLLGHTTSQITSKHYAHLLDEHLTAAVETLPAITAGKKRGKKKR